MQKTITSTSVTTPVTIVDHTKELSWMVEQLNHELDALATSDHPTVHLFLIEGLTMSIARRAVKANSVIKTTIKEITDIHQMVDQTDKAAYWTYNNDQAG